MMPFTIRESAFRASVALRPRFCWAILLLAALGCGPQNVYQPPPPPEVLVLNPVQRDVTRYMEQTGTAQASERVEVRPRISGYLVERKFEDGDAVKAGQLLFVIDEEPFQARLQVARAKESEAKADLLKAKQSKAREIAAAQVALNESEVRLAQQNLDRGNKLIERNALVQQELEQVDAALKKAQAQLLAAQAQSDQAQANYDTDVLSAQAALELAQAEVRTAEIEFAYCRITSPINGVIDRRSVDVGNYVSTGTSPVLATIVSRDPVYAYVAISESEYSRIQQNHPNHDTGKRIPIALGVGDERTFPFTGEIDYISPGVSTGTGTVQIRGVFDNKQGAIMPGMFVRIRIPSEEIHNAILVPERSIARDQVGAYLYVVTGENKVERRNIQPGDLFDDMRVVEGKLTTSDKVIVDGLSRVRPGIQVAAKAADEPAPQSESTTTTKTAGVDASTPH
ncbi:MAG TPA: efflux RND transporter periplasmic adaptor subunit [Pirellulales bacterium]